MVNTAPSGLLEAPSGLLEAPSGLDYGPGGNANRPYTAVLPPKGHQYKYLQDGRRISVPLPSGSWDEDNPYGKPNWDFANNKPMDKPWELRAMPPVPQPVQQPIYQEPITTPFSSPARGASPIQPEQPVPPIRDVQPGFSSDTYWGDNFNTLQPRINRRFGLGIASLSRDDPYASLMGMFNPYVGFRYGRRFG